MVSGSGREMAMRFIDMQGFYIRPDRQVEFQKWLTDNEERIRKSYPAGIEYGGVYVAVFTSEKNAGEYYWLDILDSYGAMDRGAAAARDPSSDYAKMGEEFIAFLDPARSTDWSRTLLKSLADATVFDLPTT
jgi:hypothetical protein